MSKARRSRDIAAHEIAVNLFNQWSYEAGQENLHGQERCGAGFPKSMRKFAPRINARIRR